MISTIETMIFSLLKMITLAPLWVNGWDVLHICSNRLSETSRRGEQFYKVPQCFVKVHSNGSIRSSVLFFGENYQAPRTKNRRSMELNSQNGRFNFEENGINNAALLNADQNDSCLEIHGLEKLTQLIFLFLDATSEIQEAKMSNVRIVTPL